MFHAVQFLTTGLFKILHSFDMNGSNEKWNIPNADIVSLLSGANSFSLFFVLKRDATGTEQTLLSSWLTGQSIIVRFLSGSYLDILMKMGGTNKQATTSTQYLSTSDWYGITITYDKDASLGSRGQIHVNGVTASKSADTLTNVGAGVPTSGYILSNRATNWFNGLVNLPLGIVNRAVSKAEHDTWFNNGKPKDLQALFGNDCKCNLNSDNSGDTAQFTITDSINSVTATSVNMADADKTTINPYS